MPSSREWRNESGSDHDQTSTRGGDLACPGSCREVNPSTRSVSKAAMARGRGWIGSDPPAFTAPTTFAAAGLVTSRA